MRMNGIPESGHAPEQTIVNEVIMKFLLICFYLIQDDLCTYKKDDIIICHLSKF